MAARIQVGDFVLDHVAQHADETGAVEELGVRGLVYSIAPDWLDPETGEVDDLLQVATSHHARLRSVDVKASDVAHHARASRIDAARYKTLATRRIGKDGRNVKPWVITVLTVAEACMDTAPDRRDVPSIFPTADEQAAYEAAHPDEAALWNLKDRLDADTDRRRTERSAS